MRKSLMAFVAILLSGPTSALANSDVSDASLDSQYRAIAEMKSITITEARKRSALEDQALAFGENIDGTPGLTGISIVSDSSKFEIHVRVSQLGLANVLATINKSANDIVPYVVFDVSSRSIADLEIIKSSVLQRALNSGLYVAVGIDPASDRVIVQTHDVALLTRIMQGITGYQTLVFEQTDDIPRPVDVSGGEKLTTDFGNCTTGFSVTEGSGGPSAILAAGHCVSDSYGTSGYAGGYEFTPNAPTLFIRSYNFDGAYDFSYADNGSETFYNRVYSGTGYTSITSAYKAIPANGATLCKYGVVTGYTCQTVRNNNYTATDPVTKKLIGPLVELYAASKNIGQCGDSGGPVYKGHVAYGIISRGDYTGDCKGGPGLLFAPIKGISSLGLTIKTS